MKKFNDYLKIVKENSEVKLNLNEALTPSPEDAKEIANIIYDTIMNNKQHEQFNTQLVDDGTQEINGNVIQFVYRNKMYKVTVEANSEPWNK